MQRRGLRGGAATGIAVVAGLAGLLVSFMGGCEPDCERTLTCDISGSTAAAGGAGTAGAGGVAGMGGSGGAGGGSSCGNGQVDAGELCFAAAESIGPDGTPVDMALGDCDGDGDVDVVMATPTGYAVLRNQGGTLEQFTDEELTDTPQKVLLGDFDADIGLDLAVVFSSMTNSIVRVYSEGSGCSFYSSFSIATNTASPEWEVAAVGRLDGDNLDDIVLLSRLPETQASVYLSGEPNTVFDNLAPEAGELRGLVVADLNGDGRHDALYQNATMDGLVLRLGLAAGGLGAPSFVALPLGTAVGAIVAGDVDKDGDNDLLATLPGTDEMAVLSNNGSGFFTATTFSTVGRSDVAGHLPLSLAIGDVDGDGDLDAVTGNLSDDVGMPKMGQASVSLFLNDGLGQFTLVDQPEARFPMPVSGLPYRVALTDINGSGALDIVALAGDGDSGHLSLIASTK